MQFKPNILPKNAVFGIIAGNGDLPLRVAEMLEAEGHNPLAVRILGEADAALAAYSGIELKVEHLVYALQYFKKMNVTHAVCCGGVRGRVNFRDLRVPIAFLKDVPLALRTLTFGDDGLLSAVASMFNKHGIEIVGAHEILPDMLVPSGQFVNCKRRLKQDNVDFAIQTALKVGALDIGQAVICHGKHVLAVEGAEGTDAMILRINALREDGRLGPKVRPILAKFAKPKQDMRMDMPTIGPVTIENAHKVGLSMLCLGANTTLMLAPQSTINLAKKYQIGLLGVDYDRALQNYEAANYNV